MVPVTPGVDDPSATRIGKVTRPVAMDALVVVGLRLTPASAPALGIGPLTLATLMATSGAPVATSEATVAQQDGLQSAVRSPTSCGGVVGTEEVTPVGGVGPRQGQAP